MSSIKFSDIDKVRGGFEFLGYTDKQKKVTYWNGSIFIDIFLKSGIVATTLEHPKHGKTILYRRAGTLKQLAAIFKKPRVHTGRGYYKAKIK